MFTTTTLHTRVKLNRLFPGLLSFHMHAACIEHHACCTFVANFRYQTTICIGSPRFPRVHVCTPSFTTPSLLFVSSVHRCHGAGPGCFNAFLCGMPSLRINVIRRFCRHFLRSLTWLIQSCVIVSYFGKGPPCATF